MEDKKPELKLDDYPRDFMVLCPFHKEKTPSCVIRADERLYTCFSCGEMGNVDDDILAFKDKINFSGKYLEKS